MDSWHPTAVDRSGIMAMFETKEVPEVTKKQERIPWQHKPNYVTVRGKHKYQCACGAQGEKRDSYADAVADYTAHVGLREKKGG